MLQPGQEKNLKSLLCLILAIVLTAFVLIGHQYRMNLSFSARRRGIFLESIRKSASARIRYDKYITGEKPMIPWSSDKTSEAMIIAIFR